MCSSSVLKLFRLSDSEAEHAAAVIPLSRLQAQLEQLQHGEQMLLEFHARIEATVSEQRKSAFRPETGMKLPVILFFVRIN